MRYLPIQLDVKGRGALVLGAVGEVVSKIERLLEAGAVVTVVAEGEVSPVVEELAKAGAISLARRPFEERDLDGQFVVFAAIGDEPLARRLYARALAEGRLFCAVDRPETCTFANPALVALPDLTIAFGTGGQSPGTLKRIREDLTALFSDERFSRYMRALGELRESLPREERFARMSAAVAGFAVEARLRFPGWFERGEKP